MIHSLLDVRERDLIVRLPGWTVKQLPVGDLWIGLSGESVLPGGIIAERKKVEDLIASILDGRYREQRTRLLSFCEQNKAKPLYIIEGSLERNYVRLSKQAVVKHLTRLTLRYGVSVYQTASLDETAEIAKILQDQMNEDVTVFQGQIVSYADTLSVSRKSNKLDNLGVAMLTQCPGVSSKVGQALISHFGSFSAILHASQKDLENVKNGDRRVGPAVAKRLYELFHAGAPDKPTAPVISVAPSIDNQVGISRTKT
jgi:ERCC4-type nuclease